MSHPAPDSVLLITENPEPALKTTLEEQGWLVCVANSPAAARALPSPQSAPVILIDIAFYYTRNDEVAALRASLSAIAPYFIALSNSYDEDVDAAEDVFAKVAPVSGLARRVQRGFRYLAALEDVQKAQDELADKQREMEENDAYLHDMAKHLVEMNAQTQGEILCTQAQEAERISMAKVDTILQATGTLRHKIFNPLFAIQANTEGALKYLNFWLESGVPEVAPVIEKLDCVLQGSDRIHSVVDAFAKLVVPITEEYLPGVPVLALEEEPAEARRLIA